MAKNKGLGKGLAALIPERPANAPPVPGGEGVVEIPVAAIETNPYQPRKTFEPQALSELAQSIRQHGVIQPILVTPLDTAHYQLVVGERRWRASLMAGRDTIPAIIRHLGDQALMEFALLENLQRADLNPMEESEAYHRLIDEFRWTQEALAERVAKSRSHVANYLRLSRLEPEIQDWVREGLLSMAHAKALLSLAEGGPRRQLAKLAVEGQWSVRTLQQRMERLQSHPPGPPQRDVHLKAAEAHLRRRLGTKVTVRGDGRRGRIEIPYASLDELERLLAMLDGETGNHDSGEFVV